MLRSIYIVQQFKVLRNLLLILLGQRLSHVDIGNGITQPVPNVPHIIRIRPCPVQIIIGFLWSLQKLLHFHGELHLCIGTRPLDLIVIGHIQVSAAGGIIGIIDAAFPAADTVS